MFLCHHFSFFSLSCTTFFCSLQNLANLQMIDEFSCSLFSSSCSDNEDINAYVKEMTKEITAEIKSEIREVINQVEDVLENSEAVDLQTVMANISRCDNKINSWQLSRLTCFCLQRWRHEKRFCFCWRHCRISQGIFQRLDKRSEIWDSRGFKCCRRIHFTRLY